MQVTCKIYPSIEIDCIFQICIYIYKIIGLRLIDMVIIILRERVYILRILINGSI